MFEKLPDDVLNYINVFIDNKCKVYLYISKLKNEGFLKICYITYIEKSYPHLTDQILKQNIFDNLIEID